MSQARRQKSTIVRTMVPWPVRTGIRLGSWLAPRWTAERAGELFCTPMRISHQRARTADAADATIKTLRVGSRTLHLYFWGNPATEPTVLCCHGWSSYGLRFTPWVSVLRRAGFAVVSFDQFGHGRNRPARTNLLEMTEAVERVGQRIGPLAGVVAHSLGGTAATLALARGLHAERVVLLAPSADGVAATERFAQAVALPEPVRARMQESFERRFALTFANLKAAAVVPELRQPVLVFHAPEDLEVPFAEGEVYARLWPGAELVETPGLGHHKIVLAEPVIRRGVAFLTAAPDHALERAAC
jgi:pimeloyl-ACP methyl ester carboxylesterase